MCQPLAPTNIVLCCQHDKWILSTIFKNLHCQGSDHHHGPNFNIITLIFNLTFECKQESSEHTGLYLARFFLCKRTLFRLKYSGFETIELFQYGINWEIWIDISNKRYYGWSHFWHVSALEALEKLFRSWKIGKKPYEQRLYKYSSNTLVNLYKHRLTVIVY